MRIASSLPLLVAGLASGAAALDVGVRLISWNIRLATGSPGTGEEFWAVRRPRVRSTLNFETAGRPETLLCFQEVLHTQLLDLESDLGSGWTRVGVGRDDGVNGGEFSPIFFQSSVWDLVQNQTYWLSETPDVPSKGWDAALNRIVTVTELRHKKSKAPFVFMCTHFDHIGQTAREESANLLGRIATEWQNSTSTSADGFVTPVFLGGDLNIAPDNQAYKNLVAPGNMYDTRGLVDAPLLHGHVNRTFTGFGETPSGDRIDHIFVKDPTGLTFSTWGVLETRYDDKVYSSDHRPVVVQTQFTKKVPCKK